jgi:hypothetical protein
LCLLAKNIGIFSEKWSVPHDTLLCTHTTKA